MKTYSIKSCKECPFRNDLKCAFYPNELDESMLDDINTECDINEGICFIADAGGYDDDDEPDTRETVKV